MSQPSCLHQYPGGDLIVAPSQYRSSSTVLYGVREAIICAESPAIRNLLHAGRAVNPSLGKCERCPLVIPYDEAEVELVFSYLFGSPPSPDSFSRLCLLLKLTKALGMKELRGRAIAATYSHHDYPYTDPASAALLAVAYGVKEWFLTAFKELISSPVSYLTGEELRTLGCELLYHVLEHRKRIEYANAIMLVKRPQFARHQNCETDGHHCRKQWENFWEHVLAPMVIDDEMGFTYELIGLCRTMRSGGCRYCYSYNWLLFIEKAPEGLVEQMAEDGALEVWDSVCDEVEENEA